MLLLSIYVSDVINVVVHELAVKNFLFTFRGLPVR